MAGRRRSNPGPANPGDWLDFVQRFAAAYEAGANLPLPKPPPDRSGVVEMVRPFNPARKVLLCSPHPDDEALSGALPLRLRQEEAAAVLNLALTLGSDPERRQSRRAELTASCARLDFGCRTAEEPLAFAKVNLRTREEEPRLWDLQVKILADHFRREKPLLVCLPHARDRHPTHEGTHFLVLEALKRAAGSGDEEVLLAETETWHPCRDPNLLVGLAVREAALLVAALACHRGEMNRLPYHLLQPARLMENTRRGAELLGGFGAAGPGFLFGELYRLSRLRPDGEPELPSTSLILPPDRPLRLADLQALFRIPDP